jgi:hypothetical protein
VFAQPDAVEAPELALIAYARVCMCVCVCVCVCVYASCT